MHSLFLFLLGEIFAVIFSIGLKEDIFNEKRSQIENSNYAFIKMWHIGLIIMMIFHSEIAWGIFFLFLAREAMSSNPFSLGKEYRNNSILVGVILIFLVQLSYVVPFVVSLL